jgi:hypothetical protein
MARRGENGEALAREVFWMAYLRQIRRRLPVRFDVPEPLRPANSRIFRIDRIPGGCGESSAAIDSSRTACAFVADPDYFRYPNSASGGGALSGPDFLNVMGQSAYLLGRLAADGILHRAPIPLFHNRVQVQRRRDGGRYEWFRAGRLDRWLASCAYPNFGPTGLRDFEHLEPLDDGYLSLYRAVGAHFLSLLLVGASYFRSRAPALVPANGDQAPVDVRHLFEPELLHDTVHEIFIKYYQGFTGSIADFPLPVDVSKLVARMIEEMGVDRHMEEILRKADQKQMSDSAFRRFLQERGQGHLAATRGAEDIVLRTGPHLGAFNDVISLPELIAAVEAFSGLCVAGRFRNCHR